MDAGIGIGFTLCGKFRESNTVNNSATDDAGMSGMKFLTDGFGRSDLGASVGDLADIGSFRATGFQASQDCRLLLQNKNQGYMLSTATDSSDSSSLNWISPAGFGRITTITSDVFSTNNAANLFDLSKVCGGHWNTKKMIVEPFLNISPLLFHRRTWAPVKATLFSLMTWT